MEDYRRKVRNSEEDRQHLEAQAKKFREEGEVSASALVEIEKERAKVEEDIERNKEAADSLQSALEYRNNQRARYENRRNEICRVYMDRVAERADPFEEKLSDLKLTREQLNEEIGHHRELLAVRNAKLAELRKLVDAEKFMSVRRAHREMIKKIERAAQEISEEIVAREEDRGKIDKKIIKQDKKANPLRDQYNRLARITKRRGPDTSVGAPKEREQASLETREVGGHPMIEGEEDTDRRDESSYPSRKSRPEFEKKYSAEELVETWNKANGSRMKISLETAKKNFPKFFEGEESVDDFWRFTGFYAERFGDQERFEGMPNMQKAARRKRGFWSRLFGRENRSRNQSRFLDFLGRK